MVFNPRCKIIQRLKSANQTHIFKMNYLQKIRLLLSRRDKKNLILLVIFSIIMAFIESVGISAIMPFIDVATDFSAVQNNHYYQTVFTFFDFQSPRNFAIAFGLALFAFFLFRVVITLLYTFMINLFANQLIAKLKYRLFKRYLALYYQDYATQNHSTLTKVIVGDAFNIGNIVTTVLLAISEVFIVLFLYVLMLIVHWKITLVFSGIVLIKLFILIKPVGVKIKKIGIKRQTIGVKFFELLNRSFGNFKYLKLQSQDFLTRLHQQFFTITQDESKMTTNYSTISIAPKLFLETLGFSLVILLLVYLLSQTQSNLAYILPTLSLFVLALYRLLPSINRIIAGYNVMLYYHKSIDVVSEQIAHRTENIGTNQLVFHSNIELSNVSFCYQDGKPVLKNISLNINKGEKIAFVGISGAGKSTLVDLIIGLYQPQSGQLKVDGHLINQTNIQSWRAQVGYIPQQVYLFDGTVAENVYFGREIDTDKLTLVLKQANIFDFLQQKSGVKTLVGEGGVQLSGGQKQRIAIARALYSDPEILVLDEATSALDNETEQKIMNEIYDISTDKTLIIIAHRLSTIKNCERVYTIADGVIVENQ